MKIANLATVATVLEGVERSRVDAATGTYVSTFHARTVREAIVAVRERPVNAVLLSPRCVSRREITDVARLAREFPGVPMFAVVSRLDRNCGERLLQLGMSGVQSLVDLSRRDGWLRLRSVVGFRGTRIGSRVISAILSALGTTTPGTRRFFEALVTLAPTTLTARRLAARLQVPASTFTSRFFRAALPSPKRYLSAARLVHSAALLEMRGLSLSDVAYRLDFSSPQSFSRHVKSTTGMTAGEFRERLNFRSALNDFTGRLILPFRVTFRTFHPFDHGMGDLGHRR